MRRGIVRVLPLLLAAAGVAQAYPFGPPPSKTGAVAVAGRPAEPRCTDCHTGNPANDPSGSLELLDLPSAYEPGRLYTVRLRLTHVWDPPPIEPRWGFQVQAVRKETGDSAGVWVVSAADSYQVLPTSAQLPQFARRRYLEHTIDGIHAGQPGPAVEWALHWQAPPGDSGLVYFFAAGNSANGDNRSSGDYIFTEVESLPCAASTDAPRARSLPAVPELTLASANPFRDEVSFRVWLPGTEEVSLEIFDLQGRLVRVLARARYEPGAYILYWNGRNAGGVRAAAGIYLARLTGVEHPVIQVRRIILLR